MSSIKGGEYPLSKIFCSDFDFFIPSYQRPYSWTDQETGILFDDLYDFYKNEKKEESYFLGSIVLKRNYLILRLDSFMSDGAASYKSDVLSIEHVLPQTVSPGSEWEKTWTDVDDRSYWLNKIGNLIPLTKRHNSKAQNYDFKTKKEKYFKNTDAGVTSYTLATDVLNYDEWTPEIVKARQKKLIGAYKKGWDLEETKVDNIVDNAAIQVIKTISENDIRARILRIPAKIKERIPESMTSYNVTFNGAIFKELTIAKERDYFAKVTELYKKYGLIDADGSLVPKQITWSMDERGTLSATIE